MQVFRIALAKYANSLQASGRAARWNPNEVEMIYTAGSRSLAALENVVHRNQAGLNNFFQVMTIEIPDDIPIDIITLKSLPTDWSTFEHMPTTQGIGQKWILAQKSAILQVPSSIIPAESNYLINPLHPDFKLIRLLRSEAFIFDKRIKM